MRNWSAYGYLALALAIIYFPVVILVIFSFQDCVPPALPFNGLSFQWYEKMFENERLVDSLINSVVVAELSSLATTAMWRLSSMSI